MFNFSLVFEAIHLSLCWLLSWVEEDMSSAALLSEGPLHAIEIADLNGFSFANGFHVLPLDIF